MPDILEGQPRPTRVDDVVQRLTTPACSAKEKKALQALAKGMVSIFNDDPKSIYVPEAVELSRIRSPEIQMELLIAFANGIIRGTADNNVVSIDMLTGYVFVLRQAQGTLSVSNAPLGPVLYSLQQRLDAAIQQAGNGTQYQLQLLYTLSMVLDTMVDLKVHGLGRIHLHEPLLDHLRILSDHQELRLAQTAGYAYEALLALPNDEGPYQAFLRNAWAVAESSAEIAGAVPTMDPGRLLKAAPNLLKVPDLIESAIAMVKDSYETYSEGANAKRNKFSDCYVALRYTDMMIGCGALDMLADFMQRNPCCEKPVFLCGLYAQLERAWVFGTESLKGRIVKLVEEIVLPEPHSKDQRVQEWLTLLADTLGQSCWKAKLPRRRHKLRKWKNEKYKCDLTMPGLLETGTRILRAELLGKAWVKSEEARNYYVDAHLREWYIDNGRLEIKRLSGDLLDMEQCYINLSIIEYKGESVDAEQPYSAFTLLSRLQVAAANPGMEATLPALFNERELPNGTRARPQRILIRGRAGVGKSTLCKKIVNDFVRHQMWENHFDRILWIPLRRLKGMESLDDFFHREYFPMQGERDDLASTLRGLAFNRTDKRTLFLLDGLDEISGDRNSSGTELTDIFKGLLNQNNVIITSRPYAVDVPGLAPFDLRLETVGFLPDQVQTYLSKAVTDKGTADMIRTFINSHWLIQDLVRIPIQLDALCYSWDSDFHSNDMRQTVTALYQAIEVRLWKKDILQLGKRNGIGLVSESQAHKLRSRSQIKVYVRTEMQMLECLAFTGLHSDMVEFGQTHRDRVYEQLEFNGMSDDILDRLSFLRTSDSSSKDKSYHFLHLTFQEYFAAQYFVSNWVSGKAIQYIELNSRERKRLVSISPTSFIQREKYSGRHDIFWRFVAGLLYDLDEGELCRFLGVLDEEPRDLFGPTHQRLLMRCFSEIPPSEANPRLGSLRKEMELGCLEWTCFEFNLSKKTYLCGEAEFPDYLLTKMLEEESGILRDEVLLALSARKHLLMKLIKIITVFLRSTSEYTRKCALDALGNQPYLPEWVLAVMATLLRDTDERLRCDANFFLSRFPLPERVLEDFVAVLVDPLTEHEHQRLVEVNLRQRHLPKRLLDVLVSRLVDAREDTIDWAVVQVLAHLPERESISISHTLALQLDDSNPRVKRIIGEVLGRFPSLPEITLDALVARFDNTDPTIRVSAVAALLNAKSLPNRVLDALVCKLEDVNEEVREVANNVLFFHVSVPESFLPTLVPWCGHSNSALRNIARRGLKWHPSLPEGILNALVSKLNDTILEIRRDAMRALGGQHFLAENIIDTIISHFDNPDLREDVIRSLGRQTQLPERILNLLMPYTMEDSEIGLVAVSILTQQSSMLPEGILGGLVSLLGNWAHSWKILSAFRSQSPLPEKVVDSLILLLGSPNTATQKAALNSFQWRSSLPERVLRALVQFFNNPDVELRIVALDALSLQSSLPERTVSAVVSLLVESTRAMYDSSEQLRDAEMGRRVVHTALVILRKQSRLSDRTLKALASLLGSSRAENASELVDILLRQDHFLTYLPDMGAESISNFYNCWLRESLKRPVSCRVRDGNIYIDAPDGRREIPLSPEKADILKHAFLTKAVAMGVPGIKSGPCCEAHRKQHSCDPDNH